jgi:hypothetical protein
VALAGDHAQVESEKWRHVALYAFCAFVSAVGFLTPFVVPLALDLRPVTVVSVALTAIFLAFTERAIQTGGKNYAPLTAVIAASSVVFGHWAALLVIVAFAAVRLRMSTGRTWVREVFSATSVAQFGAGVGAAYAMTALWNAVVTLENSAPQWLGAILTLVGILAVGMVWQIVQHGFAQVSYALLGRPVYSLAFLQIGLIASFYGYLLVAMYGFGGLLAAAIFYVLVAQTRAIQDIIGLTRRLGQLEHARSQASSIMRELMRFTDTPNVQFTGDVENIAQMLARHLGLPRKTVQDVGLAAELHEIGKTRLPARLRSGRLQNPAEESQRRTYSRLGAVMLRSADALLAPEIADYIEYHTEHYDGTGYPKGLSGDAIPIASRIIAVARGYVCLLTGYEGTPAAQKQEALRRLKQDSGTLYDPSLVDLLAELVS